MALIKTGAIVTIISGKLGGQTFGTGPSGIYIKNTGNYITNNSIKANAQKNKLVSITSRWRTLEPEEQSGWQELADQLPYINRVGDEHIYSGFNMFTKFNYNRMLIETGFITEAPAVSEEYPATEFYKQDGSEELIFEIPDGSDNMTCIIAATQSMSRGTNQYKKYLRNIGYADIVDFREGLDITDWYDAVFPSVQANTKVFFSCKMIDTETGQQIGTELITSILPV